MLKIRLSELAEVIRIGFGKHAVHRCGIQLEVGHAQHK